MAVIAAVTAETVTASPAAASEITTIAQLIAEHKRLQIIWRTLAKDEGDDTPAEDAAWDAARNALHAVVTFPCRILEAGAMKARHLMEPAFIELVDEDDVKALLQSMIDAGDGPCLTYPAALFCAHFPALPAPSFSRPQLPPSPRPPMPALSPLLPASWRL